jgi:hypothetical protein
LFVFVERDDDGTEAVVGWRQSPTTVVPLLGADRLRVEDLTTLVRTDPQFAGRTILILCFGCRELIGTIDRTRSED